MPSFTEYVAPDGGHLILGCVRTNSPRLGSRVNPRTFPPTVSTMVHALPYMQYPAATISFPGLRTSLTSPLPSAFAR